MKRGIVLIFLSVAVSGGWLGWRYARSLSLQADRSQRPAGARLESPPTVVTKIKFPQPSHERIPPRTAQQAQSAENKPLSRARAISEQNLVAFVRVGRQAIAFGDILIGQVEEDFTETQGVADAPPLQYWEGGAIPYVIEDGLINRGEVLAAIQILENQTPIRFVPIQNEADAVVFLHGEEHCLSHLGKIGGHQPIFLATACTRGEIVHELLHALGFIHEHSRTDRDRYVEVLWDQIDSRYHGQFAMVPDAYMDPIRDTAFDYESILLYQPDAFALNPGEITLRSKIQSVLRPRRDTPSKNDLERVSRWYHGR